MNKMIQIGWQGRYRLSDAERTWCDWFSCDDDTAKLRIEQNNDAFEVRRIYAGEPVIVDDALVKRATDALLYGRPPGKEVSIKQDPAGVMRHVLLTLFGEQP